MLVELSDIKNKHTQTEGFTFRELEGLDKTLQSIRGEPSNNLTKLSDLDKERHSKGKTKTLQEADSETDKKEINRLKNLE